MLLAQTIYTIIQIKNYTLQSTIKIPNIPKYETQQTLQAD